MNGRVRIEPSRPYLVIPDRRPPDIGERPGADVQEAPAGAPATHDATDDPADERSDP